MEGQATLETSLDSLSAFGLLVGFGSASGPVKNFDIGILAAKGSHFVTRPTLMTFVASDEALHVNVADLFEMVGSGAVNIEVTRRML